MINPKKLLAMRGGKEAAAKRAKSSEPLQKSRTSADGILSMFRPEPSRQQIRDDQEKDKEKDYGTSKVAEVSKRIDQRNLPDVTVDNIRDALASHHADGNVEKAAEYLELQSKAWAGTIIPYDRRVNMVGAKNRDGVTCYLDSLLFAMFAKLDAYEDMLKNDFSADSAKANLAAVLRLWVNLLRSGKLIQADVTKSLQDALADCGWADAALLEQQDTSEAFGFISETLQHPLLPLQVDLFHHGMRDEDDHKVVYERLLNLAIPDVTGVVKLEDCLEEYFNTQVDVLRDSQEEKKGGGGGAERSWADNRSVLSARSTIRLVTEDDDAEGSSSVMASPMAMSPLEQRSTRPTSPDPTRPQQPASPIRPSPRHRSTSVIQRVLLNEHGKPSPSSSSPPPPQQPPLSSSPKEGGAGSEDGPTGQKGMRVGSTVVKAVTIPAWQFFRLIPWNSAANQKPSNDQEVAMNFNQRPVVGICLKRYTVDARGEARRHDTYVDIPDSLRLPHFMRPADESAGESANGLNTDYKLVLQSVVCHRGNSLLSGHYVAFARVAPKLLVDNRRHSYDPPPDYEEAQWVLFDDLGIGASRVEYVDDIRQCLKDDMPYLLFYQILPMMDSPSTGGSDEARPPSYADSLESRRRPQEPAAGAAADGHREEGAGPPAPSPSQSAAGDYFESTGALPRLSLHEPRTSSLLRLSIDTDQGGVDLTDSTGVSRRGSVILGDMSVLDSAGVSPAVTPGEETTAQRLSRAAARLTRGTKSRPVSQAGEGRISLAKRGFGGLMRTSREPVADLAIREEGGAGARLSLDVPPALQDPQQELQLLSQQQQQAGEAAAAPEGEAKGHRRAKSRDKSWTKMAPERECVVM